MPTDYEKLGKACPLLHDLNEKWETLQKTRKDASASPERREKAEEETSQAIEKVDSALYEAQPEIKDEILAAEKEAHRLTDLALGDTLPEAEATKTHVQSSVLRGQADNARVKAWDNLRKFCDLGS